MGGIAPRVGEEIAAELIRRRQKIDQDELEFSVLAAQFAETDEYDWQGFDGPIAWIKANCHLSGGAAGDRICVGRQLAHLNQSSSAMANGEIGFAHFALIARTSAAVGERLDQTALLRQARKHTIARFHDDCYHARHAADPKGCAAEEAQRVEARSLDISDGDEGTVYISGYLDKVGGAAVRTALEPLAKRAGKDDHRPRDQRMADALVDLSMRALDNGLVPQRAHLQLTASIETLLGLLGAPGASMEFSLPISAKAVERRCARGEHGVLTADLGQGRGENRVRLRGDAHRPRLGLDRDRRRASQANDLRTSAQGTQSSRLWLYVARMRPAGEHDRRPSSCALDPERARRPSEPDSSLLPASLDGS